MFSSGIPDIWISPGIQYTVDIWQIVFIHTGKMVNICLISDLRTTILVIEQGPTEKLKRGLARLRGGGENWEKLTFFVKKMSPLCTPMMIYRVFIKYCVFSEFFRIFRTLPSLGVSLCTQSRQVENQRCCRTGRVKKNHKILRKKHNINTLYKSWSWNTLCVQD